MHRMCFLFLSLSPLSPLPSLLFLSLCLHLEWTSTAVSLSQSDKKVATLLCDPIHACATAASLPLFSKGTEFPAHRLRSFKTVVRPPSSHVVRLSGRSWSRQRGTVRASQYTQEVARTRLSVVAKSPLTPLHEVSALRTAVAPLPVDTTSTATTLGAHSACSGVLTEIHSRENVHDGLHIFASKVTPTFEQAAALAVSIHWSQHLRSACARVDEVPAGPHWMPTLRAPQQDTLGRAMHDGGQGLQAQVGLVVKHARHDHVTSALGHLSPTQRLSEHGPLLRISKHFFVRDWQKGVEVTQWHRQESRGADFARVQAGPETEQSLSQTRLQ